MSVRSFTRWLAALVVAAVVAHTCGFDESLREYLSTQFWYPLSRYPADLAATAESRLDAPFAGMAPVQADTPLARLRAEYQRIASLAGEDYGDTPETVDPGFVEAARADQSLTPLEREELDLIDAKIDIRARRLQEAGEKLRRFLSSVRTPEYASEARGWLAHVHYSRGEQSAAGKLYLDELAREDSNLSRETLLTSLRLTYRYDGGPKLIRELEDYFDTPAHAAFAIQLATNPRWDRLSENHQDPVVSQSPPYTRITELLERHRDLFHSQGGADTLGLLAMRTAMRAADPQAALRIARAIPAGANIRTEPEFLWMLGGAYFLNRDFSSAGVSLRRLFRSRKASANQRAAAAYGLCGVYQKTGNTLEQIRMALWLASEVERLGFEYAEHSNIYDQTIYWAISGWDLGLLLEVEAPVPTLQEFLEKYPKVPGVRYINYALAVRLARQDRYSEAAEVYSSIGAHRRAARMRELAALHKEAHESANLLEGKLRLAEYLADNPNRIYFNDRLWRGVQRYALSAESEARATAAERKRLLAQQRLLKDDQEERWRAYLLADEVVRAAGPSEPGRQAAKVALRCLRRINTDRFGRENEIRRADIRLSVWLKRAGH